MKYWKDIRVLMIMRLVILGKDQENQLTWKKHQNRIVFQMKQKNLICKFLNVLIYNYRLDIPE